MSLKAILELQFCQNVKYLVDVNTHSLLFEEHRLVCPADTVWDPWGRQELRISWTNNQRKYAAEYTQGHSLLPDTVENITIRVDSNIHIGNYYLMFLCLLLISEEGVWHPNFGRVCQSQVVQLPWNSFTTVNKKLESKHTVAENYPLQCELPSKFQLLLYDIYNSRRHHLFETWGRYCWPTLFILYTPRNELQQVDRKTTFEEKITVHISYNYNKILLKICFMFNTLFPISRNSKLVHFCIIINPT